MLYALDADIFESRWLPNATVVGREASEEALAAGRDGDKTYHMRGTTAFIPVTGPLTYKYDIWTWLFGGCSYQGLMSKIQTADTDPEVTRIVLVMDTPGGEVTGISEAVAALKNCSKELIAYIDPCCASAGLWLASQCDRIVSTESGEVGSLGVQRMAVSLHRAITESGVDIKLIRAAISPDKNLGHPYEEMSDQAIAEFQRRVDKWGARFVADVANGRGVTEDKVRTSFGQGKMLYSDEALSVGLIDEVKTLADLLAENSGGGKLSAAKHVAMLRPRL